MDTGDNVIVINASKVKVTGRKAEQKEYFRHTGYMGHERFTPFAHDDRQASRACDREGRLRHAAEDRSWTSGAAPQAPRVRQRRASARRAAAQDVDLHKSEEVIMADMQTTHTIGRRKEARLPRVPQAGLRQVGRQRTHARRLLPAPVARHVDSAAVRGDRHARPLRREGERRRRRQTRVRPARCASPSPARSSRSTRRIVASFAISVSSRATHVPSSVRSRVVRRLVSGSSSRSVRCSHGSCDGTLAPATAVTRDQRSSAISQALRVYIRCRATG